MGNYEQLKQAVSGVIKANGNQEITGEIMQNTLLSIISSVGSNATFAGIATPETNPGTPDQNVFYITSGNGIYVNFSNDIEIKDNKIYIITNKNGNWQFLRTNIVNFQLVYDAFSNIGVIRKGVYNAETILFYGNIYRNKKINLEYKQVVQGSGGITGYADDDSVVFYSENGILDTTIPNNFAYCKVRFGNLEIEEDYFFDFSIKEIILNIGKLETEIETLKQEIEYISENFDSNNKILGTYKTGGSVVEKVTPIHAVRQFVDDTAVEGDEYIVSGFGGGNYRLYAFVDSNNNIILKDPIAEHDATNDYVMIKAPKNTAKVIFSSYLTYNTYFRVSKNGWIKLLGKLETEIETLKQEIEYISENFDSNNKILGTYKTGGSVVEKVTPIHAVRQFVDDTAVEGDEYIVSGFGGGNYRLYAFVDSNNNIILKDPIAEHDATNDYVMIKAPKNTAKVIFSSYLTYNTYFRVSKNGWIKLLGKLETEIETLKQEIAQESKLQGKKIEWCGDSIMIGQPSKADIKNISILIDQEFGSISNNRAKGGSVLVYPWYTGNSYSIYWQLQQVNIESDYIIIQGGVNGVNLDNPEAQNYAPMGEITNGFEEDLDLTTQIGCLEAICKYAISNFVGKKVGFILTYNISSYEYWRQKAVKFQEVLDKWGIPYLDWRHSGINLASLAIREKYGIDTFANYEEYSNQKTYQVDDKVRYENEAYKAKVNIDIPEEWNPEKWDLISTERYDGWHCNGIAYILLAYKTAKWLETL